MVKSGNNRHTMDLQHLSRRDVLWLLGLAGGSVLTSGLLGGCAVDPVTGEQQLMLMSESQEIDLDRQRSPHQFSADYGPAQDKRLSSYLDQVGHDLSTRSHRPKMPYSFRAVNASYINAYAFPGGSIAATRGILLELNNEAELAALLGHEIGHVNARHAAERATKGIIATTLVAGAATYTSTTDYRDYAGLVQSLGGVGTGALLARYSRENEREADALGMEYMTRAGYTPDGMIGLMEMLTKQGRNKPGAIEMMFATHPMSTERYNTARQRSQTQYAGFMQQPDNRERYMDYTADLRRIRGAVTAMQDGEKEMRRKRYQDAENHFDHALQIAPEDYAALVMMAKCQVAMNRPDRAGRYTDRASLIYPQEAQARHVSGISMIMNKRFGQANQVFSNYERMLPGNTDTVFFKALSLEGMQRQQAAAKEYYRYLRLVNSGPQARHAHDRLVGWGYLSPDR